METDLPPVELGIAFAFVLGAVIGSFLNVCICRMPEEKSVVSPPSHCPNCDTELTAKDNVPLLSFLILGRKCRYCGEPISWQYFIVELLTGLLFVAVFLRYGYTIDSAVFMLFMASLVIAFAVDLRWFIIPDQVPITGLILGIGGDIARLWTGDPNHLNGMAPTMILPVVGWPILSSIVGMVIWGGVFYLVAAISYPIFKPRDPKLAESYEGAMGGGDVKLAAATGAVLGVVPAMVSFFIAVILGAIVGIVLLISKGRAEKKGVTWRTEIPFGPYMVAGAVAVMLLYPQLGMIWQWYLGLSGAG